MKAKQGIQIDIPGFGRLDIHTVVTDYTGTLSCGGKLSPGVRERLLQLEEFVEIRVLTSDTFHTARSELAGIPVTVEVLENENHHRQKENYVTTRCDPARVAVFGNGNNDRLMLQAVKQAGRSLLCYFSAEIGRASCRERV